MSYCRWSSVTEFGNLSDVYVYKSNRGYEVLISGTHINNPSGDPHPTFSLETQESEDEAWADYLRYEREEKEWRERNQHFRTELELSGETFIFETAGECADFLTTLWKMDYHIPFYAIEALREEEIEKAAD